MKKIFGIILAMLTLLPVSAQKFGYVDTKYIMSKMPEYQEYQGQVDKLAKEWEGQVREMRKEIDGLYAALNAEEVLLTPEMKSERLAEIKAKENQMKKFQTDVFGFEGLLYLKKKELIKPVQDEVFEAIEKVCRENRLAIMFDKAGELIMIYTDPRHDYTDFVLETLELGDPNDTIQN